MRGDALKSAARSCVAEGQMGQVVADAVACANGWRARTILWPDSGVPEVHECLSVDATQRIALHRAQAIAIPMYPEQSIGALTVSGCRRSTPTSTSALIRAAVRRKWFS